MFSYGLLQTCVWAVLDAVFFFWAIVAPFSYQQFKLSGKIRIAHIICVLATGSVSPTTNWIATSCGWLYTVLFTSIILFTTEQVLWLLHFITPNLHFCWNHDIHADLHHMDHIQGINYNYGKNNYEQEP